MSSGVSEESAAQVDKTVQSEVVQKALSQMVATKMQEFASGIPFSENMGVLVYAVNPAGAWTAAAGVPGDDAIHYRIASVSKTFTAAAIMLLDQQGKLRIDDFLTWQKSSNGSPGKATTVS